MPLVWIARVLVNRFAVSSRMVSRIRMRLAVLTPGCRVCLAEAMMIMSLQFHIFAPTVIRGLTG